MAIKHNAQEANDKADLKALRKAWGAKFIKDHDIEIDFAKGHVTLVIPELGIDHRTTRKRWGEWVADGFPGENGEVPLPPLTPAARKQAARQARAEAPAEPVRGAVAAVEARPKAAPLVEPSEDFLGDLAHRTLEVALAEREGDHGKNAARFRRGELMLELAGVAKASGVKIKDALIDLNERTLELAENNAIIGYEPINEQEASRTRKVVQAFGSSGEFRLVNAISRVTGEPVVLDDGQPPLMSLTDVALNKLVPLTELAEEDPDEVLSFAYRHNEKVVGKAKSVAKQTGEPLIKIIRKLDRARVKAPHPVTGELIEVQPEGREAIDFLGALVGEEPTPDVVSIKTSRGFYEAFFEPLKQLMSAVASRYNPSLVAQDSEGQVSNVLVLEHTIAQYFNVHEDAGVKSALGAMVRAETISQRQAEEFLDTTAYDPDSGEWLQVRDVAEAADALDDYGDWEDDPEVVAEVEAEAAVQGNDPQSPWDDEESDDDFDDDDWDL